MSLTNFPADGEIESASNRVSDRVAHLLAEEVANYGNTFTWDYSLSLVPTPQGIQAMGLFCMFMKNPLLGTGDIAIVEMIPDLTAMTKRDFVRGRVADVVRQLREQHAKNLQLS